MNHKLFLTLSLLMSVMCQTINAQPDDRRPQISGQLLDADLKEPVVQATIQLFAVSDSTFAGGTVSDLAGTFSIEVPSRGTYRLRIYRPDLCGGALLDLGVYALNFVRMFTDADIVTCDGHCVKTDTGMDLTNAITIVLSDGLLASVQSSAACVGDNTGVIAGPGGNIIIDNINNPQTITLNGPDRQYVRTLRVPQQITGYEYQFEACRQALADGLLEPREMPHRETLYIMQIMDQLRQQWDVRYPMD